jgi:hypothetical protein
MDAYIAQWHDGCGFDKLIFTLQPSIEQGHSVMGILGEIGALEVLGPDVVAMSNLHQSASIRYAHAPGVLDRLMHAGSLVHAPSVRMVLSQLRSKPVEDSRYHWIFSTKGKCDDLYVLIETLRAAIVGVGLPVTVRNSAHLTVAYRARRPWLGPRHVPEVICNFSHLNLVIARTKPYRYETLASWSLDSALASPIQTTLIYPTR